MTVDHLASIMAKNLPDDTGTADVICACGYILSVAFAQIADESLRASAIEKFADTLRSGCDIAARGPSH